MVLFVEKEDGSYGSVQTGSYMSKNHLVDFVEKRSRLIADLRNKMISNEISSIVYYLTLREMSVPDLAVRVGIPVRDVKRHMTPRHFGEMSVEVARRYAEVFGVALADLFQIDPTVDYLLNGFLRHKKTRNAFMTIVDATKDRA
jgi:hypothetical protein